MFDITKLTQAEKDKLVEEAMKARDRRAKYNRERWAKIKQDPEAKAAMYADQKKFRTAKDEKIAALKAEVEMLRKEREIASKDETES